MAGYAQLTHISLTGVDDQTDLARLTALSSQYPLVEWGMLYSPKRQGLGGRYPSVQTLQRALQELPPHVRVALHVCGGGVPGLLSGEAQVTSLVEAVAARGGRVQLNFSQSRDALDLEALSALLTRYEGLTFIVQENAANEGVATRMASHANFAALFDASGGMGVERDVWPAPLPGVSCGYAGGLGPDNLAEQVPRIRAASAGRSHWIDIEGKLRTADDVFDLGRAQACLIAVMGR